jgi:hypothetical protein
MQSLSRWKPAFGKAKMISGRAADIAGSLMSEFAMKTGLSPAKEEQRRYLWTDAFAVCNFLELFARMGDEQYRRRVTELIDQVHRVLGRYRDDDIRSGWISGLEEEAGCRHPTSGGLRIGKPLKERSANEPLDERLEWDRDGQYFHYLTKWVHALCQTAFVLGDVRFAQLALELGKAAFEGFARRSESGGIVGIYWKMSTDLSRPLVPAVGLHDALDGFITFREVQHALAKLSTNAGMADLSLAIGSLSALCQHRNWTTDDPLGLGGLLFDAGRLCQIPGNEQFDDTHLLEDILVACRNGLANLLAGRYLNQPVSYRLAFRELGLAIGLKALPIISDAMKKSDSPFRSRTAAQRIVAQLFRYESLSEEIVSVWLPHAQSQDQVWQSHQDINEVMLATALIPETFLSVGERVSS